MTAPTLTRSDPRAHPGMTPELASRIVDGVLLTFASGRVDLILQGFTEDAEMRFGPTAVLRGRNRIRGFLEDRFAERVDRRFEKRLRAVDGGALAVDWCDRWTDRTTGRVMRSEGSEFWTLRDGLLDTWEVASARRWRQTSTSRGARDLGSPSPSDPAFEECSIDHIGSRRDQHRQP